MAAIRFDPDRYNERVVSVAEGIIRWLHRPEALEHALRLAYNPPHRYFACFYDTSLAAAMEAYIWLAQGSPDLGAAQIVKLYDDAMYDVTCRLCLPNDETV